MPYDDDGNFIYPIPIRKGKAPANPKPKPRPLPVPVAANLPSAPLPVVNPVPVEPSPMPTPTPEVPLVELPPVDTPVNSQPQPVLTIQEGSNRWQMSELDLALIWNAQLWPGSFPLRTVDGRPVEIIYRGRWSGGFGPDFKGALLRFGSDLLKGDVELHLRSGDWNLHGHQNDRRYNEVVLQVTLEDNAGPAGTATEQGKILPVLALLPLFKQSGLQLREALEAARASGTRLGSLSESDGPCCDRVAEHHTDLSQVLAKVQRLGEQRFEEKADRFEMACAVDPDGAGETTAAAQELWASLLESLGYSQNKAPFRRLADALPLSVVVELDREARMRREAAEERLLTLETVLLGAAGLLPSQRSFRPKPPIAEARFDWDSPSGNTGSEDFIAERYTTELEGRWSLLERQLRQLLPGGPLLTQADWTFARLRPPNHPARRIAGLARLVLRWKLNEAAELVEYYAVGLKGTPEEAAAHLNQLLRVAPDDAESDSGLFWTRRYDFTDRALMLGSQQAAKVDLIGESRAADMIVNVVLPFLAGYGRDKRDPQLVSQALEVYRGHPPLSRNELIDNVGRQVFRYWLENPTEAQLEGRAVGKVTIARLVNNACRQQGLIHLHHHFCAGQDYSACPLS
jgi:hypothetical protein